MLAVIAASFLSGPSHAAETANVAIENFRFDPERLTVAVGTRIVFSNRDPMPHSVVGFRNGEEVFRSPEQIETDETYTFITDKSGELDLNCGLHARIVGRIIVTP